MKKVFRIFCKYKNRKNYSILTPYKGLSRLGTRLMVILLCGMRPHAIRDFETYSVSWWRLTGIWQYHAILCPYFCGVEHSLLLGWFTCSFHVVIFTRSQAMLQLDLWIGLCRDSCPYNLGLIRNWSGMQSAQSNRPWSQLWELQPWVPNLSYARKRLPLTYLANKKEH